jgi:hypothetical protein
MKRIKAPIMAGITDCEIKHRNCLFSSYSRRELIGLAGIGSLQFE